ncbi:MFS transporter [Amycolatopsis balhimycina DSM 5908]|uniref:MFS transporter n=1 Tax=Amycolatopsis balhimycina DSM 5908 TaxID=1081091 RepID=A0A428X1B2_AMYBA|nr:MFS transporter [Amycolatopsis balhimycina]RSM49153.1 MFS transporter [Amycolatopsis balhimycina DSM 5908]
MVTGTEEKKTGWWSIAAAGAGVIALCYGFARYAYGLFVPRFSETFGLTTTAVGVLGGLSTAGYGLGLLVSPATSRRSARGTVILAGASATIGLALMAAAPGVVVFGAGIVLAGTGAGLVSPGVAQLIGETVGSPVRARAQTWANTGTGLGLAASAFTPLLAFGWPAVWWAFAVIGAGMTVLAWRTLPRTPWSPEIPELAEPTAPEITAATGRRAAPLVVNSVLIGATSAPYWTFSNSRLAEAGLSPVAATWCWATIGVAGLLGGLAGRAAGHTGLRNANLAAWTLAAAGIALLALPRPGLAGALLSSALFGTSYMALTGLCILWATRVFPARPARGVTWSFAGLGAGQTAASPLAGAAGSAIGLAAVFGLTGLAALLAWSQLTPRLAPPSS